MKQSRYISTCRGWRSWNRLSIHDSLVVVWWLCISSSGETWKFDILSRIWPWRWIAPQNNRIFSKLFCTSGPNLVILAWMGDELWCRQAQNEVNLDFQVKFDLEGQEIRPQNNGDLNQGVLHLLSIYHQQRHIDTHTQAKTIPEGQNWPWVKSNVLTLGWIWKKSHYRYHTRLSLVPHYVSELGHHWFR